MPTLERVIQLAQSTATIGPHGGDRKGKDQGAISTLKRRSAQAAYLAARIARDRWEEFTRKPLYPNGQRGLMPWRGCRRHRLSPEARYPCIVRGVFLLDQPDPHFRARQRTGARHCSTVGVANSILW